jgi:hypothetical protein
MPADRDWKQLALQATNGTQFGAIVAAALGEEIPPPRFGRRASVTSDGFVMCNFVDREGQGHPGAFVGSVADLERNIVGFPAHIKMTPAERKAFYAIMRAWIAIDYRSPPGLRLDDGETP